MKIKIMVLMSTDYDERTNILVEKIARWILGLLSLMALKDAYKALSMKVYNILYRKNEKEEADEVTFDKQIKDN